MNGGPETTITAVTPESRRKRLWFGTFAAGVAWTLTGLIDGLLAWQACMSGPAKHGVYTQLGMHILLGVITFGFLAITIIAGVISFRNWRAYSQESSFLSAEGRDRREFMSMAGVFVAASLGMGIIWFALAVYIIRVCMQAR
ncbi:MAG: hypothetical protein ACRD2B_00725 [Terriglobia bacterium]